MSSPPHLVAEQGPEGLFRPERLEGESRTNCLVAELGGFARTGFQRPEAGGIRCQAFVNEQDLVTGHPILKFCIRDNDPTAAAFARPCS